LRWWHSKCIL